jgi:cell fate (sporulation/competence/biofilm development) regulator YlbF (YheA/YmcA/DUF963 family)
MTTATVGALIDRTTKLLDSLLRRYDSLTREFESSDSAAAEFTAFLATRERGTIATLAGYCADEHPVALDVHVRLASGFPFATDDLEVPEHPTLDELAELAEQTDTAIEQLCERIKVYAASGRLLEILDALEQIVERRRHQLAGALRELEEYRPSPPQSPK